MAERKKQSLLSGAFVLVVSAVLVKVIGLLYKIPLTALIGEVGRGYFSAAYNIFTPVYAVSMAGLPIAVSGMVSRNMALNKFKQVKKTFRVALSMFAVTGIGGTALLLLLAYPYSFWLINSPETFKCIIAIAPSVFFCCIMSAYRAYYEGLANMVPTAVSQVIEAVAKMALGIGFAYMVMKYGMNEYEITGAVFGTPAADSQQAQSLLYPWTASAAILGVSVGTVSGWLYLWIYKKIQGSIFTRTELINSPLAQKSRETAREMITFSMPVMTGSIILNITSFLDNVAVQNRLAAAVVRDTAVIKEMYGAALSASGTLDKDISVYLYGVYGAVMDFRSLVPTITMTLGISAIPVISAAWAINNKKAVRRTINSVIRTVMLVALPAGFAMAVLSEPILRLIYGGTRTVNMVEIAAPMLTAFGFATPIMAVSGPVTHMLQAVGRTDVPVKSLMMGATVKIVADYILVGNPQINIYGAPVGAILNGIIVVFYELACLVAETGAMPDIKSVFLKPFFCACMSTLTAKLTFSNLTDFAFLPSAINLLISVLAAAAVYLTLLVFVKGISGEDLRMLPKGEKIAKRLEKFGLLG